MIEDNRSTDSSSLAEPAREEIEIHLAEYTALSEFQRIAKSSFIRLALYHNTGIVIVIGWILSRLEDNKSLINSEYLLPILLFLPTVNAVLIVACAYQIYSFYCVARHFQSLRMRLSDLVLADVLVYENKFVKFTGNKNEPSIILDIFATSMWLIIPIFLALASSPSHSGFRLIHQFSFGCIFVDLCSLFQLCGT